MATRRAIGAIAAGVGAALEGYGSRKLKEQDAEASSQRTLSRTLLKDYSDRVAKGDMEPDQAEQALRLQGIAVPAGYFAALQPSPDAAVTDLVKGIGKTKDYNDLPTEAGLSAELPKRVKPLLTPDVPQKFLDPAIGPSEVDDPNTNRLASALNAKRNTLQHAGPITEGEGFVKSGADAGAPTRVAQRFNPRTETMDTLSERQTGPGAKQKGVLAGEGDIAKTLTENRGGLPEATAEATNRTLDVTSPVARRVKVADLQAEKDASWPYDKKEIDYRHALSERDAQAAADRNEGASVVLTGHDEGNNEIPLLLNKKTGVAAPIDMPQGTKGGRPVKPTATQVQNQTELNTAETIGVRALEQLKASGLDKSNNPLDARWTQFMLNNLKMDPKDAARASVQWDAAFLKGTFSKALMGGRPSEYIAEMMQPHLPDQAMTGARLAETLKKLLPTVQEKRENFSKLARIPIDQLMPASGKSWKQYLEENMGGAMDATGPATVKYVNGQLVPAGK